MSSKVVSDKSAFGGRLGCKVSSDITRSRPNVEWSESETRELSACAITMWEIVLNPGRQIKVRGVRGHEREEDDTSRKLFGNKTLTGYFVSGGRSLNRCVIKFSYVFWVRPG